MRRSSVRDTRARSDTDRLAAMNSAAITRIDENDRPVSSDEALKESSEVRQPVAAAAPEQTMAAARPVRRHLPRTASELPMLMLLAGLSLAGAAAVRLTRWTL